MDFIFQNPAFSATAILLRLDFGGHVVLLRSGVGLRDNRYSIVGSWGPILITSLSGI